MIQNTAKNLQPYGAVSKNGDINILIHLVIFWYTAVLAVIRLGSLKIKVEREVIWDSQVTLWLCVIETQQQDKLNQGGFAVSARGI